MKRTLAAAAVVAALIPTFGRIGEAQRAGSLAIRASAAGELRAWDDYVTARERAGVFRVRREDVDPSLPSRVVERLQQYHAGVRIWGAEVVRDSEGGVPQAIIGEIAPDLSMPSVPALGAAAGRQRLLDLAGPGARLLRPVELVVLPLASGEHRLAYTSVASRGFEVFRLFADANAGAELLRYSVIQSQSAVGSGQGVFGSPKKVSAVSEGAAFFADDRLRPPVLRTFDMRGNVSRAITVAFAGQPLAPSDRASDTDNVWTDPATVDAHAHIGWTYDYYYKRHGRQGLDGQNRPITTLVNPLTQQGALSAPPDIFGFFAVNAFWCGECGPNGTGVMLFGSGLPPNFFLSSTGNNYTYFAGALDIAAHELTHGVLDSSSQLIYQNESGALNESFADMMGTSAEFFFHPAGEGQGRADYVLGEDISRALRPGARDGDRSLENPGLYGDPDHYSLRFTGPEDNGGVHTNSGIPNHAFYLAIEGGTNRTSGLAVQGVGAANREQIEKVFYRAFVFLLPPNATFATARAATIQAARDLYGAGGAPERAVTQAWTAVGVN